jgi:hypothetical protein
VAIRPALPITMLSRSTFPTCPNVAMQFRCQTHFTGWHADCASHWSSPSIAPKCCRPAELPTLSRIELNIVDLRSSRYIAQRQCYRPESANRGRDDSVADARRPAPACIASPST